MAARRAGQFSVRSAVRGYPRNVTRAPRLMLAAAALCVLAFVGVMYLAYYVGPAARLDATALNGLYSIGSHEPLFGIATKIAHTFNPAPYAVMGISLIVFAAVKRGMRHAVAVAVLLLGANASSQILKPALAHYRDLSDWPSLPVLQAAAFPSGHTAASMSLAFGAVMAAPRAWKPLVAIVTGTIALVVA